VLRLQGHDAAVQAFEAALRGARMHHAYLITGPAHVGKLTLAIQIAQAVNCLTAGDEPCGACEACTRIAAGTHADVRVIRVDPEATEGPKTAIGIDAVRELIASAHLRPYEGRTRVFVLAKTAFYQPSRRGASTLSCIRYLRLRWPRYSRQTMT